VRSYFHNAICILLLIRFKSSLMMIPCIETCSCMNVLQSCVWWLLFILYFIITGCIILELKQLNTECCVQITTFQPVLKLRKFLNRMSGVLRRRYSVFIHSGKCKTPDTWTQNLFHLKNDWNLDVWTQQLRAK
jgi:hypothetical protein